MTNDLVEKLRALHVWPQVVADDHADLLTPRRIDKLYEVGRVSHEAADLIETQAREIERLREALERIGIYGCGMLSQPAAMNGPEETWLKQRIFEMERTARAALGDNHE